MLSSNVSKLLQIICQIFTFETHLFGVNPKLRTTKSDVNKLEMSLCRTVWNVFWCFEPFAWILSVTDIRMDRQNGH